MNKEELAKTAQEAQEEFVELCQHRFALGEKKYGPGKWLTVDTLNEALYELADLSNYAMMTFMRIRLIQQQLEGLNEDVTGKDFTKDLD